MLSLMHFLSQISIITHSDAENKTQVIVVISVNELLLIVDPGGDDVTETSGDGSETSDRS